MGKRELEVFCIVSNFINMCAAIVAVASLWVAAAARRQSKHCRLLKTHSIWYGRFIGAEKCAFDVYIYICNIAIISYGRFWLINDNFEKSTKWNFIIFRWTERKKKKDRCVQIAHVPNVRLTSPSHRRLLFILTPAFESEMAMALYAGIESDKSLNHR